MNVITSLAPIVASAATLASSPTLILALGLIHLGAKAIGRLIPDNRRGILGGIRKAAKVLAVEPHNRVADNTSLRDLLNAVGHSAPKGTLAVDATGAIKGFTITNDGPILAGVDIKPDVVAGAAEAAIKPAAVQIAADITANAKAATIAQVAAGKIGSLLGKLKI
jgi:hypothetical protein